MLASAYSKNFSDSPENFANSGEYIYRQTRSVSNDKLKESTAKRARSATRAVRFFGDMESPCMAVLGAPFLDAVRRTCLEGLLGRAPMSARPPAGPLEGTQSGEPLFTLAKTTNTTVEFTVC